MKPSVDMYPSALYVNGRSNPDRTRVDFDRVEIGHCNSEEIRELCMDMGNDTDPFRNKLYQEASCKIRRSATIGKDILNLLRNHFTEVTYEEDAS